jgi:hypothetical protein
VSYTDYQADYVILTKIQTPPFNPNFVRFGEKLKDHCHLYEADETFKIFKKTLKIPLKIAP